jgi:hypothetical protein
MNDLHVVARRVFFPTKQSPRLNGDRHVHKAYPELACLCLRQGASRPWRAEETTNNLRNACS